MVDGDNTRALSEHTTDLIEKALRELRAGRSNSSSSKEQHFRTATYLLEEGRAYVRGAWSMVASGNAQASLALSRWVLEAAMNLWWVVGDSSRVHERLRELVGEALRNEACLREALIGLYPEQAKGLRVGAEKARETRKELGIGRRLKSLQTRMEDVKPPERPNWPDLYVLYRICCLASHPALRVWGRYRVVGSATVSSEPMDHKFLTPELGSWMAAASALYLVSHCYCVTETGRLGELTDWWNTKAAPLLR